MQNPAIQPVTTAKQTVDSRDKTAQRMCTLLGKSEREGATNINLQRMYTLLSESERKRGGGGN